VELNHATRELDLELRSRATVVRLEAESLVTEAKLLRGSIREATSSIGAGQ
jgi:hypothetical protein